MINIDTKNKLEHLEKKVEDLERQLKEKTTLEDTVREMEKRLMIYEDKVRSDKGEITLKKNFVIKNRKGKIPGRDDKNVDNTVLMYFNDRKTGDLNHIFIGTGSVDGFNNNSFVGFQAIKKEDAGHILNNGNLEFSVLWEDDLNSEGVVSSGFPNLNITDIKSVYGNLKELGIINSIPDVEGIIIQATARGEDGFAALAHYEDNGTLNMGLTLYKNNIVIEGIPTSDPVVAGAIYNDSGTLKISSG